MKREVYEEYGVTSHGPGDYERFLFIFCSPIKRDHFILWHWVHPFFLASSGEAPLVYFLTERMRLSLSPHPQLSVIPHSCSWWSLTLIHAPLSLRIRSKKFWNIFREGDRNRTTPVGFSEALPALPFFPRLVNLGGLCQLDPRRPVFRTGHT
jgi:hypothetical protein